MIKKFIISIFLYLFIVNIYSTTKINTLTHSKNKAVFYFLIGNHEIKGEISFFSGKNDFLISFDNEPLSGQMTFLDNNTSINMIYKDGFIKGNIILKDSKRLFNLSVFDKKITGFIDNQSQTNSINFLFNNINITGNIFVDKKMKRVVWNYIFGTNNNNCEMVVKGNVFNYKFDFVNPSDDELLIFILLEMLRLQW